MLFGRDMNLKQEVEDSHVTMKDLSKGIAIAQLFVDSLAQHDPYDMEDIFKLKSNYKSYILSVHDVNPSVN